MQFEIFFYHEIIKNTWCIWRIEEMLIFFLVQIPASDECIIALLYFFP